jgi:hypothetical protein
MVKTFVEVKGYYSKRKVKVEISGYYSPKRGIWVKPHTRKTRKTVYIKGYFRKIEKKKVTKEQHIKTKNVILCQIMAKKKAEEEIRKKEERREKEGKEGLSESEKKKIEKQSFKSVWDTFLINHWKTQKLDDKQVSLFISLFY